MHGPRGAFQAIALAAVGFILAFLAISVVDRWRASRGRAGVAPLTLVYSIAAGIGLHNLGEGLAIGAAYATGAIALGTFLVIGFAAYNTTEGLAIAAPLARGEARLRRLIPHLMAAGAIAGVPTIFGAWLGGFAFSPIWATLFLAIGAGAIFQVVWQIVRMMGTGRDGSLASGLNAAGLTVGLLIMYGTGLLLVS
jgi:zinc transporter ZupT